jgi:hypothetical protein
MAARFQTGILFLAGTLLAGILAGQSNYGSLRGRVTDPTGSPVPGATITVTDPATNRAITVRANEEGVYVVPALRPVTYDVVAESQGFKQKLVTGVKIDTAREAGLDLTLEVGSVSERIEVTGEAPLLQTVSGAVTATVDQKTIVEMPLNGRNTLQLALILPGTSGSAGTEISELTTNEPLPGRELSINGSRIGSTQFFADGTNVTSVALARMSISFTPDTIQEFSVQQSNYSAQYSQAGGAIIQQTTKSGTNEIRGTGYWFHRQKAFTANPFGAQRSPVFNNDSRPPLRRQQLGATVGGPVWLPKVYNGKDKTFFFFAYEPTRQLASNPGGPTFVRVPTADEINGDFSKTLVYFRDTAGNVSTRPIAPLYQQFFRRSDGTLVMMPNPRFNPAAPVSVSNSRFLYQGFPLFNPNDPDPARRGRVLRDANGVSFVNPVAQRIMRELYPQPNITNPQAVTDLLGANFAFFRRTEFEDDRYSVRLDHRLTNAHQIYGRWTEQPQYGNRMQRDVIQSGLISDANKSRQIMATLVSTPRPTMVNELRLNYVYGNFGRNFPQPLLNRDYTSEYLNIGGPGQGAVNLLGYGMARFYDGGTIRADNGQASGAGFDAVGFNQPQDVGKNIEHTYGVTNDFSWVRGNMTWKMGFAASHLQLNQANLGLGSLAGGRFAWNANTTAEKWCRSTPIGGNLPDCTGNPLGGDKFAAFLLGVPEWVQTQTENLSATYYYRWKNIGAYVQNDWKVNSSLTLNLGLRYQYQSPRWEKNDFQGMLNLNRLEANPFVLDLATGQPLPAPVFEFAGADGRSRYLTPAQKLVFEPRFGFAWTPAFGWNSSRKLVVRGGYGMTHGTLMGNDREPLPNLGSQTFTAYRGLSYLLGSNDWLPPTNIATCGLARCNEPEVPMQLGFNNMVLASDPSLFSRSPSGLIRPGDTADISLTRGVVRQDVRYQATGIVGNPNFRMPTVHNYSLQLQYQVMANTVFTFGYQGSRGHNLFAPPLNLNRVDPFTGQMPIPGFAGRAGGAIYMIGMTNSGSTYHAMIAEIERRFYKGLQFRFNYTWSKLLDDSSGGINFPIPNNSFNNASADVPLTRNQNPYNLALEKGLSSTDTPHIFNMVGFWELPFGRGKRFLTGGGWVNQLVGDWQWSTLGKVRSGYPMSVTLGRSNSLDTGIPGGALRPDLIPGVPLRNPDWTPENALFTPFVNPRAFAWPAPGQYGNAARNYAARLPWVRTFDMSLSKRIRPFENGRRFFELRAEFFNVFNIRNYESNFNTALLNAGDQNPLLAGTAPFQTPIAGVENRFAALRTPGVWDAIIAKSQGVPVDTVIAQLAGPGPGGLGCPSNAAELGNTRAQLSPACAARVLGLNTGFYRLNLNTYQSRIVQFALKFYF